MTSPVDLEHDIRRGTPTEAKTWRDVRMVLPGPVEGQADFILLLPQRGLALLQVTPGKLAVEQGRWYQNDRELLSTPLDQAVGAKSKLAWALRERGISPPPIFAACHFSDTDLITLPSDSQGKVWLFGREQHHTVAAVLWENLAAATPTNCNATAVAKAIDAIQGENT